MKNRDNILANFKDWKLIDTFSDHLTLDGYTIQLAGLACENDQGAVISGSAAGSDNVEERAFYELLERLSIFEYQKKAAPMPSSSNWRYALSSGVAIHDDFARASENAMRELLERDAVLASWYGLTLPKKTECRAQHFPTIYQFELYHFETLNGHFTSMCLARPLIDTAPLLYGFSCQKDRSLADHKACEELVQRIGFLYQEEQDPEMEFQPSALYLQEFYLRKENHYRIDDWLQGKHGAKGRDKQHATVSFVDITPKYLNQFSVVKAVSKETIPLIFGKGYHIEGIEVPEAWQLHPIV